MKRIKTVTMNETHKGKNINREQVCIIKHDENGNIIYREKCIKDKKSKPLNSVQIFKYDKNNNEIYFKEVSERISIKRNKKGNMFPCRSMHIYEAHKEYDSNNNLLHFKDSNRYEEWYNFDKNNNLIHYKNSNDYEHWYDFDEKGNCIHDKNSKGEETWQNYDSNNNCIYYKSSDSYGIYEECKEYDENGNMIHSKNSYNREETNLYVDNRLVAKVITNKKDNDIFTETTTYSYRYVDNFDIVITDKNGSKIIKKYDKNDKLLYQEHNGVIDCYEYDHNGKLINFNSSNGDYSEYGYNDYGHIIYEKSKIDSTEILKITKYEYYD